MVDGASFPRATFLRSAVPGGAVGRSGLRRAATALLLAACLLAGVACKKNQASNPLAHVNSKQPDKVLYDRAMEAMKQKKYEAARLTLQTLISAYPDSEYVARAKLTVGESWYDEGSATGLDQAESEFRDFITFFPNSPEASEAQLKIADIHYRQMGKPDRDYKHARRAEDEYRQLLLQYPDSKQAEMARLRLLEVQEVLAEREFRIARFYLQRGALLAAIARAKTLTDTYPLYSRADEALYTLGQAYELHADAARAANMPDAVKQRVIKDDQDNAAEAYSRIVTRYPAMAANQDARRRLAALKRPVPTPTPEAIAQNKKELASRTATTAYERFLTDMGKRPDLSAATRVGEPSMTDPKETDAPELAREINSAVKSETAAKDGSGKVVMEAVSTAGAATENQPAPHTTVAAVSSSDVPEAAPSQFNESSPSSSSETASSSSTSAAPPSEKDDPKNASTSHKAKKKKHFHIPFPL